MRREFQFLIEMDRLNIYEGFNSLQRNIFVQDNIDDRFEKNDYIDLVACTLLYHQIIEKMLFSILVQNQYIANIREYPNIAKKMKIPKGFYKKIERIKRQKDVFSFKNIDEFINLCIDINKIRNVIAHEAISDDEEYIICKLNKVKKKYHRIRKIYQEVSTERYNIIKNNIWSIDKYLNSYGYTDNDKEELKNYIINNYDKMDLLCNSIAMGIYIYLYKEEFDIELNNIHDFWEVVMYGNMEKEEIMDLLHIN